MARTLLKRTTHPSFIEPMQARLVQKLPEDAGWMLETKLDGYPSDNVEIRSRNDKDLSASYPTVCAAVRRVKAKRAVLDGEIVAVDASGVPSFQALQHRSARTDHHIAYYVFDLLHIDGVDLTRTTLTARRAELPMVVFPAERERRRRVARGLLRQTVVTVRGQGSRGHDAAH
jgi:bifunctional non-homologous end joining protein LigD